EPGIEREAPFQGGAGKFLYAAQPLFERHGGQPLRAAGSPDGDLWTRKISATVAAFRLWRGSPLLSFRGRPDRRHVPARSVHRTPSEKRSTPLKRVEAPFRAKAPLPPWSSAAGRV